MVGRDVLMLTVQSPPQVRVVLDRPLPRAADVLRVMLQKAHGRDARVEVRLVVRTPFAVPELDPAATGTAVHAVRHLPADAPDLAYVGVVRAADIAVVGEDANVSAPSVTSDGKFTRPVTRPRAEVEELRALDRVASGQQRA